MAYLIYYGSDSETNQPDTADALDQAVNLAHQSILSVIGGNAWARIECDDVPVKAYRYDEHGDCAGQVYEVNI